MVRLRCLVGSVGFLISFLPFQRAFEQYRALSNGLPNEKRLMDASGASRRFQTI